MTAVVTLAEKAGKEATPLVLPTNNPLYAIVNTAASLQVQELILGASNQYSPDEQLEQIAFYWINVHQGAMEPLTVRILSRNRDVYLDLGGGNRIPRISERQARSVAELRSAGVGVSHALLVHDDTPESSDLFKAVLTMLDPLVALTVVPVPRREDAEAGQPPPSPAERHWVQQDVERAQQLRREVDGRGAAAGRHRRAARPPCRGAGLRGDHCRPALRVVAAARRAVGHRLPCPPCFLLGLPGHFADDSPGRRGGAAGRAKRQLGKVRD